MSQAWGRYDPTIVCSWPGCETTQQVNDLSFTDFRVVCAEGEEGFADVTMLVCEAHIKPMALTLAKVGFVSHRHGGVNYLEADVDVCGGYGNCPTPAEYGQELAPPHVTPPAPPLTCDVPVCDAAAEYKVGDRNVTYGACVDHLHVVIDDHWLSSCSVVRL